MSLFLLLIRLRAMPYDYACRAADAAAGRWLLRYFIAV